MDIPSRMDDFTLKCANFNIIHYAQCASYFLILIQETRYMVPRPFTDIDRAIYPHTDKWNPNEANNKVQG